MREGCGGDGGGDVRNFRVGCLCDILRVCLYHGECDRGILLFLFGY